MLTSDEGSLETLPNDEYRHLLGYLSPKDKLNLKLSSRACEKRVLVLDPAARKWKIWFCKNKPADTEIFMKNAKERHSIDGTIQNIEITFVLAHHEDFLNPIYRMISDWKNRVYGLEHFIPYKSLDIKFPNLKTIKFASFREIKDEATMLNPFALDFVSADIKISKEICAFVHNHSDTLECLVMDGQIMFEFKNPNLKKLILVYSCFDSLVSILKSCKDTLEYLDWNEFLSKDKSNREFNYSLPKLKAFHYSGINCNAILKSCKESLRNFTFRGSDENPVPICTIQLQLEFLYIENSNNKFAQDLLVATQLTLKTLTCFSIVEKSSAYFDLSLPNLSNFTGVMIDVKFALQVISSAQKTLKYLTLNYIASQDTKNIPIHNLTLISFTSYSVSSEIIESVIKASQNSLKNLCLHSVSDINIASCDKLNLKNLECIAVSLKLLYDLCAKASSSLEYLKIGLIKSGKNCNLIVPKLNKLRKLHIDRCEESLVASLIKSASQTLEALEIRYEHKFQNDFNLQPIKSLRLREFVSNNVNPRVLTEILEFSRNTLNKLEIRDIYGSICDSVFLNSLSLKKFILKEEEGRLTCFTQKFINEYKARNPNCIVEVYPNRKFMRLKEQY